MELNDKEWQIVEPLFPELPTGHRGRPWRDLPRSIHRIKRVIVVSSNGVLMER